MQVLFSRLALDNNYKTPSMSVRIYWIHQFENKAKVGIMARPRGNEWLKDEVASLHKQNVSVLVSLLEMEEVIELGLREEERLCVEQNIKFISFPIEDRSIPNNESKTKQLLKVLSDAVKEGNSIVIHCRMGIGRSSIIAGAVVSGFGLDPHKVLQHISNVRGLKVPDTEEQTKWLYKLK